MDINNNLSKDIKCEMYRLYLLDKIKDKTIQDKNLIHKIKSATNNKAIEKVWALSLSFLDKKDAISKTNGLDKKTEEDIINVIRANGDRYKGFTSEAGRRFFNKNNFKLSKFYEASFNVIAKQEVARSNIIQEHNILPSLLKIKRIVDNIKNNKYNDDKKRIYKKYVEYTLDKIEKDINKLNFSSSVWGGIFRYGSIEKICKKLDKIYTQEDKPQVKNMFTRCEQQLNYLCDEYRVLAECCYGSGDLRKSFNKIKENLAERGKKIHLFFSDYAPSVQGALKLNALDYGKYFSDNFVFIITNIPFGVNNSIGWEKMAFDIFIKKISFNVSQKVLYLRQKIYKNNNKRLQEKEKLINNTNNILDSFFYSIKKQQENNNKKGLPELNSDISKIEKTIKNAKELIKDRVNKLLDKQARTLTDKSFAECKPKITKELNKVGIYNNNLKITKINFREELKKNNKLERNFFNVGNNFIGLNLKISLVKKFGVLNTIDGSAGATKDTYFIYSKNKDIRLVERNNLLKDTFVEAHSNKTYSVGTAETEYLTKQTIEKNDIFKKYKNINKSVKTLKNDTDYPFEIINITIKDKNIKKKKLDSNIFINFDNFENQIAILNHAIIPNREVSKKIYNYFGILELSKEGQRNLFLNKLKEGYNFKILKSPNREFIDKIKEGFLEYWFEKYSEKNNIPSKVLFNRLIAPSNNDLMLFFKSKHKELLDNATNIKKTITKQKKDILDIQGDKLPNTITINNIKYTKLAHLVGLEEEKKDFQTIKLIGKVIPSILLTIGLNDLFLSGTAKASENIPSIITHFTSCDYGLLLLVGCISLLAVTKFAGLDKKILNLPPIRAIRGGFNKLNILTALGNDYRSFSNNLLPTLLSLYFITTRIYPKDSFLKYIFLTMKSIPSLATSPMAVLQEQHKWIANKFVYDMRRTWVDDPRFSWFNYSTRFSLEENLKRFRQFVGRFGIKHHSIEEMYLASQTPFYNLYLATEPQSMLENIAGILKNGIFSNVLGNLVSYTLGFIATLTILRGSGGKVLKLGAMGAAAVGGALLGEKIQKENKIENKKKNNTKFKIKFVVATQFFRNDKLPEVICQ